MRKLLVLIYTLWKKNEEYIEDYVVAGTVQTSGNEEN